MVSMAAADARSLPTWTPIFTHRTPLCRADRVVGWPVLPRGRSNLLFWYASREGTAISPLTHGRMPVRPQPRKSQRKRVTSTTAARTSRSSLTVAWLHISVGPGTLRRFRVTSPSDTAGHWWSWPTIKFRSPTCNPPRADHPCCGIVAHVHRDGDERGQWCHRALHTVRRGASSCAPDRCALHVCVLTLQCAGGAFRATSCNGRVVVASTPHTSCSGRQQRRSCSTPFTLCAVCGRRRCGAPARRERRELCICQREHGVGLCCLCAVQ